MNKLLLFFLLLVVTQTTAQKKNFRFAFISDTHIGSPNGGAEEDLRRTVADINSLSNIAFVVITGDITELGKDAELAVAKRILDSLRVPWYIIPGNHDTGWSESGGLGYTKTFGYDSFHFKYGGVHFIGCPSGPYVRMSDGHVPRHAMNWMQKELKKIGKKEPVVFLNHYPLDAGLDNWYEVIGLLKEKNTILALCGHGHSNRPVDAEDIPAVMGRSNLRAKANEGGYNLVDVRKDSILFTERKPFSKTENKWTAVANRRRNYDKSINYPRPDSSVNEKYPLVKQVWQYHSAANVISTPVVTGDLVVFGNQNGTVEALELATGKKAWSFATTGPVFSSPAAANDKIVLGSADGSIYCINTSGQQVWKVKTGAAVLGSPLINNGIVYIGGSDNSFRALELETGKIVWTFDGLQGPVTSVPVLHNNLLVFGAWDRYLYCYDLSTKSLKWKWSNGSSIINYSPAACIPVIKDDVVYVVAPDRHLSAIDLNNGQTLWRTNESRVRESIGIAENGKVVYGKTMQDTVVAFFTGREKREAAWKMHAGYGYEHAPSMLIEKSGKLFFGTRNGIVYAIDPATQQLLWAHKIDNSMVNTVQVLNENNLVVATMDGKICLLNTNGSPPPAHKP